MAYLDKNNSTWLKTKSCCELTDMVPTAGTKNALEHHLN